MKKIISTILLSACLSVHSVSFAKPSKKTQPAISPNCASALIGATHFLANNVTNKFAKHLKNKQPISPQDQLSFCIRLQQDSSKVLHEIAQECPAPIVKEFHDGLPF